MWISQKLVSLFEISRDTVQELRIEVQGLKLANEMLYRELTSTKITSDWLRVKVNDLEVTNKALMEKAYNVKLPVPQVVRANETPVSPYKLPEALFEHIDDATAKSLGIS